MKPSQPTHEAPFRGLRVLDFGQGVASPYAGYLLAANGADVIKVEPPEGDWSRRLGTTYGNHSALSAVYNRGKRGLVLDLKKSEGIETAMKLAADADVLIEGFRPGVMDRLGLGYDALSKDNSRLIYLSISGFGQQGPYSQRPCSDSVAQAFSGLVAVNVGADGTPHRVRHGAEILADQDAAMQMRLHAFRRVYGPLWIPGHINRFVCACDGRRRSAHRRQSYTIDSGAPRSQVRGVCP